MNKIYNQNLNKPIILIICGPTASGKTDLAIECAKILDTSIVSADSMSIYKDLNIGTAKPTATEMQKAKHYMIDVVDKFSNFSVSDYKNMAEPIINKLIEKNKIPIISGGTGFYINSILYDLSYGNVGENQEIRNKYLTILSEKGNDYLFDLLKDVDIESYNILNKNDTKRVIRALEIFELSGKPKSQIKDSLVSKYNYFAFSINYDRTILYDRINKRVDSMINNGLIEEVRSLIDNGLSIKNQSMQGIGYKEVYEYLKNNSNYNDMIELIKKNTRNYAKRQITFFKKIKGLINLSPQNPKILANKITEEIYDKLKNN